MENFLFTLKFLGSLVLFFIVMGLIAKLFKLESYIKPEDLKPNDYQKKNKLTI